MVDVLKTRRGECPYKTFHVRRLKVITQHNCTLRSYVDIINCSSLLQSW